MLDATHTRFAIPIGDALSEVGGAIVDVLIADSLALGSNADRDFVPS
jgi:hypothetical protein